MTAMTSTPPDPGGRPAADAVEGPAAAPRPRHPRERPARARSRAESALVRAIATLGAVGIATAVAAVMGNQDASGWLIGLVASLITLVLTALLWARTPARRSRV